jgi:hypothetical protein
MTANIDFARMLYDAFRNGRIDTIVGKCAETVRWECVGNPAHVPHAGLFNGRNGVSRFFDNLARVYIFDVFSPDRFHACGDHVFCFGHVKARSTVTNTSVSNFDLRRS